MIDMISNEMQSNGMPTTSQDYRNNIRLTIIEAILITANIFTSKSINRATVRS